MTKRQGDALRELADKYDKTFDELLELAAECGANTNNLSPHNAILKIRKEIEEKKQWEEKAKSLGYSSVLIAMKAQGQSKTYPNVPLELQTHPPRWVTPKVKAQLAANNLKKLLPTMEEYCQIGSSEDIEALSSGFYKLSYEDFSRQLFEYVAEMKGRPEGLGTVEEVEESDDKQTVGDLLKSYEWRVRKWVKNDEDWERFLTSKERVRVEIAEEASMRDELSSEEPPETALLLLTTAFWDLSELTQEFVIRWNNEMSRTKGFDFEPLPIGGMTLLHRLTAQGLEETAVQLRTALGSKPETV